MHDSLQINVKGRCQIYDGNELIRDEHNAIHPQNLARVFAKALANEHNYFINRIAFGNGGTVVDAAYNITFKTPNDGQSPDDATWDSRLYHETFSKIIDDGQIVVNPLLGIDPGSADINVGIRTGGGSVPASDPVTIPHVSGPGVRSVDKGLTSDVVITAVLNEDEPKGEFVIDMVSPTQNSETVFMFDEIGLFTSGGQAIPSSGYQYIDIGNKTSEDDTTLLPNTEYSFRISVNGGNPTKITFKTPLAGGSGTVTNPSAIVYGDLCEAINNGSQEWGMTGVNPLPGGAIVSITDTTDRFRSITGEVTYGYLRFSSATAGKTSSISLDNPSWSNRETVSFASSLNSPLGGTIQDPVIGAAAGIRNAPTIPSSERERMLTHLIFSPVLKTRNRKMTIIYTLTISLARTPE